MKLAPVTKETHSSPRYPSRRGPSSWAGRLAALAVASTASIFIAAASLGSLAQEERVRFAGGFMMPEPEVDPILRPQQPVKPPPASTGGINIIIELPRKPPLRPASSSSQRSG